MRLLWSKPALKDILYNGVGCKGLCGSRPVELPRVFYVAGLKKLTPANHWARTRVKGNGKETVMDKDVYRSFIS